VNCLHRSRCLSKFFFAEKWQDTPRNGPHYRGAAVGQIPATDFAADVACDARRGFLWCRCR
jgi:hypothetical protein